MVILSTKSPSFQGFHCIKMLSWADFENFCRFEKNDRRWYFETGSTKLSGLVVVRIVRSKLIALHVLSLWVITYVRTRNIQSSSLRADISNKDQSGNLMDPDQDTRSIIFAAKYQNLLMIVLFILSLVIWKRGDFDEN